jgi:PAS domain S-box-containing protein
MLPEHLNARPGQDFREAFLRNPQPLLIYDVQSLEILAVSDSTCRHFGYSLEELLGFKVPTLLAPEETERLVQFLATDPPPLVSGVAWTHRRKNGEVFLSEVTSQRLTFDGRAARLVQIVDVT